MAVACSCFEHETGRMACMGSYGVRPCMVSMPQEGSPRPHYCVFVRVSIEELQHQLPCHPQLPFCCQTAGVAAVGIAEGGVLQQTASGTNMGLHKRHQIKSHHKIRWCSCWVLLCAHAHKSLPGCQATGVAAVWVLQEPTGSMNMRLQGHKWRRCFAGSHTRRPSGGYCVKGHAPRSRSVCVTHHLHIKVAVVGSHAVYTLCANAGGQCIRCAHPILSQSLTNVESQFLPVL